MSAFSCIVCDFSCMCHMTSHDSCVTPCWCLLLLSMVYARVCSCVAYAEEDTCVVCMVYAGVSSYQAYAASCLEHHETRCSVDQTSRQMQRGCNHQTYALGHAPSFCVCVCMCARTCVRVLCVCVFFLCVQADRDGFRGMKADTQERNIKARPRLLFDVVDSHKVLWCLVLLTTNY